MLRNVAASFSSFNVIRLLLRSSSLGLTFARTVRELFYVASENYRHFSSTSRQRVPRLLPSARASGTVTHCKVFGLYMCVIDHHNHCYYEPLRYVSRCLMQYLVDLVLRRWHSRIHVFPPNTKRLRVAMAVVCALTFQCLTINAYRLNMQLDTNAYIAWLGLAVTMSNDWRRGAAAIDYERRSR